MSNVGNVTIGVSIDGSALPSKLTRAIQSALGPMLADLRREIRKTTDEVDKLGDKTEKSAAKQVAANKRVAESYRDIAKAAREARLAEAGVGNGGAGRINRRTGFRDGGGNGRSLTRQVVNNVTHITNHITNNNISRGGGGGGGNGGGGGGGGGFGNGGDRSGNNLDRNRLGVFSRGANAPRFAPELKRNPFGFNVLAAGASALAPAALAVTNLAGAVQQLGQVGLVLPGVFAGIASSAGTAALGFSGLGDAIKAFNKQAVDPSKAHLKAYEQAMAQLSPTAQELAHAITDDILPAFNTLKSTVATKMFSGIAQEAVNLKNKTLPTITEGTGKIADAWNKTFKEISAVGQKGSTQGFLKNIFGNTAEAQTRLNSAIAPLVDGIGKLASTGSNFLPRFADGITALATRFDKFITKIVNNGDLDKWINQGIEAAKNFGEAALNIGKIFTDLTKAAGGDGGFLGWLKKATGELHAFLSSSAGQRKLTDFFDDAREHLKDIGTFLFNIGKVLGSVVGGFKTWGDILLPVLSNVAKILDKMPGLVSTAVTAFLAFRTLGGLSSLVKDLRAADGIITALPGKTRAAGTALATVTAAGEAGGVVAAGGGGRHRKPSKLAGVKSSIAGGVGRLNSLRGIGGIAGLLGGGEITANAETNGGKALGVVSSIAGGAIAGSVFGPAGTAAGAALGAAIGGISLLLNKQAQAQRDAAAAADEQTAAQDRLTDQINTGKAAIDAMQSAQLGLNESLLNSGGQFGAGDLSSVEDLISAIPDKLAGSGIQNVGELLKQTGLSEENLAAQVTGDQGVFDALISNVSKLSDKGPLVAAALKEVRDSVLGAEDAGRTAGPVFAELAQKLNLSSAAQALAAFTTTVQAIPHDVPLNIHADNVQTIADMLTDIGVKLHPDALTGTLVLDAPLLPGIAEALHKMGIDISTINGNQLVVHTNTQELDIAKGKLDSFIGYAQQQSINIPVNVALPGESIFGNHPVGNAPPVPRVPGSNLFRPTPGRAGGGLLPGYSPGVDNMLVPMSGGEGVIIPEAMRALGGNWLYGINSRFRRGISRRGYAGGGVTDIGSAALALPTDNSVIGLLSQIRDLLSGKTSNSPLTSTADATGTLANTVDSSGGGVGTGTGTGSSGSRIGPFGTPIKNHNLAYDMAAAAISGLGGDPERFLGSDPADAAVSSSSVLGAGGAGVGGAAGLIALAQGASGGKYQLGASDLAGGLADCSGAVSDLVEYLTKGQTDSGRLFSTANEASVLQSLGAVPGLVPGTLQIGLNSGHTAATLPNGVNFESGGSGGGVVYGGATGAGSRQFTQQFSLPVNGAIPPGAIPPGLLPTAPGLPGANIATAGAPVPVYIVNGPGVPGVPGAVGPDGQPLAGGAGGFPGKSILDAGTSAVGDALGGVASDVVKAIGTTPLPGLKASTPNRPNVPLDKLIAEGNPALIGSFAGLHVPDFTRNGGQAADSVGSTSANGQITGDTAALIGRTLTDLQTQMEAQQQQTLDILNQIKDKVAEEVLSPLVQDAVQKGFETLGDNVATDIGNAMGTTAAPIIAEAVKSAVASSSQPSGGGGGGGGGLGSLAGLAGLGSSAIALAGGGGIMGPGTSTSDSIPIMASRGEYMLDAKTVERMGGFSGVDRWRKKLGTFARGGGIGRYATGGGVIVNDTVGADFFGVSQIPIIGAIVNMLVSALLKVLGVQIEARDTLQEMSKDFRDFRGEFKEFDARGRLLNDTSGLIDRSQSSEKAVADERLRILKIVIQALVKYIIEKVIVPIAKAVANAAIQAGASAASGPLNLVAPGAGGIVSSLITSAGGAGVDIAGEVGTDLATSFASSFIDLLSGGLTSAFPDVFTGIFGGGFIENLFINPIGSIFDALTGGLLGTFFGSGDGTGGGGGILGGLMNGILSPIMSLFGLGGGGGLLGGLLGGGDSGGGGGVSGILGGLLSPLMSIFGGGGTPTVDVNGDGVNGVVNNLAGGILNGVGGGGGLLGGLLNPLSSIFNALTGGLVGSLTGLLGVFTGAAGLGGGFGGAGGGLFDDGGIANGIGYMPKATLAPERVLSPRQTSSYERNLDVLDRLARTGNSRSTVVNAPITVYGGTDAAERTRDHLLALMS